MKRFYEVKKLLDLNEFKDKDEYYGYLKGLDKEANIEYRYGKIALEKLRDYQNDIWKRYR